jgi:hypothetical protein
MYNAIRFIFLKYYLFFIYFHKYYKFFYFFKILCCWAGLTRLIPFGLDKPNRPIYRGALMYVKCIHERCSLLSHVLTYLDHINNYYQCFE